MMSSDCDRQYYHISVSITDCNIATACQETQSLKPETVIISKLNTQIMTDTARYPSLSSLYIQYPVSILHCVLCSSVTKGGGETKQKICRKSVEIQFKFLSNLISSLGDKTWVGIFFIHYFLLFPPPLSLFYNVYFGISCCFYCCKNGFIRYLFSNVNTLISSFFLTTRPFFSFLLLSSLSSPPKQSDHV